YWRSSACRLRTFVTTRTGSSTNCRNGTTRTTCEKRCSRPGANTRRSYNNAGSRRRRCWPVELRTSDRRLMMSNKLALPADAKLLNHEQAEGLVKTINYYIYRLPRVVGTLVAGEVDTDWSEITSG